ncbi:MAG: hypothetical protein M0Z47_06000 [Actinomycetota bacterium]|nr:hypothetical protein [Actinomycetota bacterium]
MARLESSLFAPGAIDEVGRDDIIALAKSPGDPAVSIYVPVGLHGDVARDKTVLRDLVAQAHVELAENGYPPAHIKEVLELPDRLLGDDTFFAGGMRGLAIFCGIEGERVLRLPLAPEPAYSVAASPWVVPLLSVLEGAGDFLILWLDLNDVRLYLASRFSMSRLFLGDVDTSIEDVLPDEDRQAHISARAEGTSRAGRVAVFHSKGVGEEMTKRHEGHFLEMLAAELAPQLAEWSTPLAVIGVGELATALAGRLSHTPVAAVRLEGSPSRADERFVHRRAWEAVEPMMTAGHRSAVERFAALAGTGYTTFELEEVAAAAHEGRAESLLVASTRPAWGRRLSGSNQVELHEYAAIGDVDLVGSAVGDALASGAEAYLAGAGEVPFTPVGAILRY